MEPKIAKPREVSAPKTQDTRSISPIEDIRRGIHQMEGQLRQVLPPHITPEKFTRIAMTAVQMQPALLQAERKSLFMACLKAAQDGLLPDGREAALVPYRSEGKAYVSYLPMVAGILKKIRNSGELDSIASQIVFKNDKFRYWVDDSGEHLTHDPMMFGDRGPAIGTYAIARTKDRALYVEVMTAEQIMAVKEASKAKGGPWSGPFEHEMWRKTVIKRLAKRLPMSTDIEPGAAREEEGHETPRANTDSAPLDLAEFEGTYSYEQPEIDPKDGLAGEPVQS